MKNVGQPFLKVVLTLSSHEPFEVPMEPVFKGMMILLNSRIRYTIPTDR